MGMRTQRGSGMSALEDVQDLAGCGPSQPHHVGLAVLGRAGLGASAGPFQTQLLIYFLRADRDISPVRSQSFLRDSERWHHQGLSKKGQTKKEVCRKGVEEMQDGGY